MLSNFVRLFWQSDWDIVSGSQCSEEEAEVHGGSSRALHTRGTNKAFTFGATSATMLVHWELFC